MTDETTPTPAEEPAAEPVPAATAAVAPADPHDDVPFWQRPNVERYLLPLITPIIVVLAIVIWVLNMSRLFLASHGHVPVVVGTIITVVVIAGATLISNARHMRSQSATLVTCGFVIIAIGAGWLVLGHSEVKDEGGAPLTAEGPCKATLAFEALSALKFAPASLTVDETGVYCVTLTDQAAGQHTLDFDNPETLFPGLQVTQAGETVQGRIFFGTAGEYTYYCAVPGHKAAGMHGVVTVNGDPITLEEAEAEGGTGGSSGATGAGGATGAEGASGASGATGEAVPAGASGSAG